MKKYLKYLSLVIAVLFGNGLIAEAQDTIQRKQLFDDHWKFLLGDSAAAGTADYDVTNWRRLELPHDWSIEGKINPKNPTGGGGGYFPAGVGWYRKTFDVPSAWKGKCVSIYFEGVYMNSEVFINGKSLGVHPYGYTSFFYDLTPFLEYNGRNTISVRVDNSKQPNCRWYSGSGIYRHVWMIVTNPVHVAHWGVEITTPEVSSEKAAVRIKTLLKNETHMPQTIILRTRLADERSNNAGDNRVQVELPANGEKEIEQIIAVSKPLLWNPVIPHLYQARIQVVKEDSIIDESRTMFGIRSVKFTAENGFQLNGKTVKMNGGCVHHDKIGRAHV